ncbi:hypothetical protein K435DRAFT_854762 [Dendrothele bispora CBS 962.96]|uniref:Carrier domain-containing protein n=1 Tax=Dendrothele bispora (strain CBS 962.96) TaxID=1314807 RepID=A0A4S8MCZ5_DENBC|nr:hypothetical protein K435DRAFT_854762 [Dendrothele bispora CBS 962.96]
MTIKDNLERLHSKSPLVDIVILGRKRSQNNTINTVLIPVDGIDNVFQLICKENKFRIPSVLNTVIDGQPALDTKDLLIRYPTKHGLFQGYGRADDQITHSTGEKTNPGPIESLLLTDKRIASAIMFGRSKFQVVILIMPSNDWVFEPSDLVKLSEYRNMIWFVPLCLWKVGFSMTPMCRATVQRANAIAPQHSRIFKEGTPRRQISLKSYEEEIENAYKAVEESSQPHIRVSATWDMLSVMVFVSEVVNDALGFKVNDHDDFFRMGADSICATYIRNTITRVMRDTNVVYIAVIRSLPSDFMYGYSSIATLSKFVYDITANAHALETGNEATTQDEDDDPEGDYVWPKMSQVGAGGRVDAFVHFQQKFRSALWLLHVTSDLPCNSLREHAEHYYKKIKVCAGPAVGSELGIGAPGLGSRRGTGVGIGSLGSAIHQTGNIVKAKFEEYEKVERGLVRRCGLGDVDGSENWDGHAGARMVGGKEEGSGISSLLKRWLWGTGTPSKRGVGLGGLATNVYPQSSKNTNANSKDVEEGPYTNSALTNLSLYLLGLKDCLVGSLNWAYETEMFFGTKGDSVRGYGWVFLLPRDEE